MDKVKWFQKHIKLLERDFYDQIISTVHLCVFSCLARLCLSAKTLLQVSHLYVLKCILIVCLFNLDSWSKVLLQTSQTHFLHPFMCCLQSLSLVRDFLHEGHSILLSNPVSKSSLYDCAFCFQSCLRYVLKKLCLN